MSRRIITVLTVTAALGGGTLATPAASLARTRSHTRLHRRHHRHALRRREGPLAHIALR